MKQKDAKLRVCASCEWIFTDKRHPKTDGCPKCGFAHYGARYVYGDKAYRYAITQGPWFEQKTEIWRSRIDTWIDAPTHWMPLPEPPKKD